LEKENSSISKHYSACNQSLSLSDVDSKDEEPKERKREAAAAH